MMRLEEKGYKLIKVNDEVMYLKEVGPQHYFIKYKGYGISEEILRQMNPAYKILIRYKGTTRNSYYMSSVRQFLDSDIPYDNDGDLQYIVPVEHMKKMKVERK